MFDYLVRGAIRPKYPVHNPHCENVYPVTTHRQPVLPGVIRLDIFRNSCFESIFIRRSLLRAPSKGVSGGAEHPLWSPAGFNATQAK
jgi:hypothetical protein